MATIIAPDLAQDQILERIAAGDSAAVKDCVDQYGGLLWSLSRRFLRNEADAEDAIQDIFIAVWSSADRFRPELGSEATFISTIARRRLIDRVRKSARQLDTEPYENDAPIADTAASNIAEVTTELENVGDVVKDMAEQQREILAMSLYGGFSHGEIADELDVPLGTVKSKIRRGLMHIRERLELAEQASAESGE